MILPLNTKFEEYTPVQVLGKSVSYREVYLAKNNHGQNVVLTVYDMHKLPGCFVDGKIPEFDILPQLSNEAFPVYIQRGQYEKGEVSLRWMTTEYTTHTTLADYLRADEAKNEREMLLQFYNLLVAVKELSWRTRGGCHNNISIDSILVADNGSGEMRLHLRGLNCVSEMCNGRATFDTSVLSRLFIAPETLVGRYNVRTDVFSLGIVLAFILQGKHPWADSIGTETPMSTSALIRLIRENQPSLAMPEPLRRIVAKAIATRPSERYRSIEDFGTDLAKYLGNENLSDFECFVPGASELASTPSEPKTQERAHVDLQKSQTAQQPRSHARIERVDGNGFKDVAGMEQLKSKLTRDFVDIVQNRELASIFQIAPPNGILLWGPPGTGKTFISRKLAEESGLLVSFIKPSDLGNIYIHGSQNMIADLFIRSEELAAKNNCGVLLVFDEFDSIVPKRGVNDDNNQANEVAEFLTRLNDCAEKNVFVVATTNRIDAIDSAIIRKGRIDEIIYVGLPDEDARKALFEKELHDRPHEEIDTNHIAELTSGYTSSDICFIVKECARCSFEESVKTKQLVKINQVLLEKTIAETRPSVTAEESRQFERTRESYDKVHRTRRPRIGYLTY